MDNLNFALPNLNKDDDEIPAPGEPGNEWIGHKKADGTFIAYSGEQRRHVSRARARGEAARQRAGQRAYNRSQRKAEFQAGTRRAQLRILKGEVEVTPAMRKNLETSIINEQKAHKLALTSEERYAKDAMRRDAQLEVRQGARFLLGKPRGKDFRSKVWEQNFHLLPLDYAGKGGTV